MKKDKNYDFTYEEEADKWYTLLTDRLYFIKIRLINFVRELNKLEKMIIK